MELGWILDLEPREALTRESSVAGRTWQLGPFLLGSFRFIDEEGGGFCFINVRGTRLGLNWEW